MGVLRPVDPVSVDDHVLGGVEAVGQDAQIGNIDGGAGDKGLADPVVRDEEDATVVDIEPHRQLGHGHRLD